MSNSSGQYIGYQAGRSHLHLACWRCRSRLEYLPSGRPLPSCDVDVVLTSSFCSRICYVATQAFCDAEKDGAWCVMPHPSPFFFRPPSLSSSSSSMVIYGYAGAFCVIELWGVRLERPTSVRVRMICLDSRAVYTFSGSLAMLRRSIVGKITVPFAGDQGS